ncbi:helix-turn-helix domain-containing protein [Companilactobacillus huachuanensis]|uniref:Helix-turn-helix domain-containing protein n=1 Tax=Companilactobacillus huachuanensis TaxID=2559914 RepID=A0ABW1RQH9_9LACO|nr:helix-turn-helix domain-containing protein [Companilactobacillus huachuanensis]
MEENVSKFLDLYPSAEIVNAPFNVDENMNFLISNQWVTIAKSKLNEHDKFLLSLINKEESKNTIKNLWWKKLTEEKQEAPQKGITIKVFQFRIDKAQSKEQSQQWLNVFKDTIDNVIDSFFIGPNAGIVIQEKNKANVDLAYVQQMVELLDSDFYTNTHMYIGEPWSADKDLSDIFNEEREFFYSSIRLKNNVNDLSTVILDYLIDRNLRKSKLFKNLHRRVNIDMATSNMINTLYECDSNMAKASKLLFVHRNTLQYRIEKFYETTGFDLKNHEDLALCFLLLK